MSIRTKSTKAFIYFFILAFSLFSLSVMADKKKDKDREKSLRQETSDQFLKKWLEQDVVYIITDEEKAAFKRLTT
ncbi:MAG: hypothetical protein DMG06_15715, partial [Acidobacteria bacterium]